MTNLGCSSLKGLVRWPFFRGAASVERPPVHSGMVPSALPALSAPNGVSEVPSFAASSGDTAAITLLASRERAKTLNSFLVVFIRFQFLLILFGRRPCLFFRLPSPVGPAGALQGLLRSSHQS